MTMHLEAAYFTTTRYSKKPHKKWASAEAKAKAERETRQWQELQQSWQKQAPRFSNGKTHTAQPAAKLSPQYPPGREPNRIPSRDSGLGVAAAPQPKVYTGTNIKGIGTLHKSNAVPIFTDEEAVAIAHMRR